MLHAVKAWIFLNPSSGNAGLADQIDSALVSVNGWEVFRPTSSEEARARAYACPSDVDLILVVGGDGTLHDVVNGLWEGQAGEINPRLAIIPLGTGNDFARTLCIPMEPERALELATRGARRKMDLIHIAYEGETQVAVNLCVGGFAGSLKEHLTPTLKRTWGPLAYLLGAARSLPDLSDYSVYLSWDDGPLEPLDVFNIVVANGRTAAGGTPAAPTADPEDGLLDVIVVREGSPAELASLAARFVNGDYLDHDLILHRRTRSLHVEAHPGMWFSADGELLTNAPITFTVLPKALEMVVGPRYGLVDNCS